MAERKGELGSRKTEVLRAVVEEYVRTGEPVGSETVAERHGLRVSSATIRNEMAALEELGYLSHPHTSAGRIPTDVGYRRYVDSLPARGRLREAQRRAITEFFTQTVLDMEEVLLGATRLLSRLTMHAGLAVPPSALDDRIVRAELVDLGSAVLLLVVGHHGRVSKRLVDRPAGMTEQDLAEAGEKVEALAELTVPAAEARVRQAAREATFPVKALVGSVADALLEIHSLESEHVLVGGVANLADEVATWRRETMRRLFEALERESEVLGLLREVSSAEELSVTIGGEHPSTGLWDAAVVAAPYRAGETSLGTIGVVGPTRMDYLTAMSAVRVVAQRLSELATMLEGGGG